MRPLHGASLGPEGAQRPPQPPLGILHLARHIDWRRLVPGERVSGSGVVILGLGIGRLHGIGLVWRSSLLVDQ